MKTIKTTLLTIALFAAMLLTACGNDSEVTVTSTTTAATTTEAVVTTVPNTDEGTATEIITTEQEEATTTTPAPVEDITTTTVTDEVTTSEITTIPEEVTTEATTTTEAAPAWVDEPMDNTTMYATTACYVRKDAVVGSDALYVVTAGKAVTIVGKTDTGYYKLADGGYIHSDYLSTQKPVEEVVTTTAPVQTEEPTTTTASTPEYQLPPYNHTNATCNGIEVVLTEEDAEAVAAEMLILVNDLRTSLGLNELQRHPKLDMIARVRAYELTTYYSHNRPDGTICHTVCQEFNFGNGMGENIAATSIAGNTYISTDGKYHFDAKATAMSFFEMWKNSSGHYANMIDPTHEYFACDIDIASGKYNSSSKINKSGLYIYGVQNFK